MSTWIKNYISLFCGLNPRGIRNSIHAYYHDASKRFKNRILHLLSTSHCVQVAECKYFRNIKVVLRKDIKNKIKIEKESGGGGVKLAVRSHFKNDVPDLCVCNPCVSLTQTSTRQSGSSSTASSSSSASWATASSSPSW